MKSFELGIEAASKSVLMLPSAVCLRWVVPIFDHSKVAETINDRVGQVPRFKTVLGTRSAPVMGGEGP